jgi:hypothetical protein
MRTETKAAKKLKQLEELQALLREEAQKMQDYADSLEEVARYLTSEDEDEDEAKGFLWELEDYCSYLEALAKDTRAEIKRFLVGTGRLLQLP